MFLPLSAQSNEQTSAASLLDRALQNLYEDDFIQTMTLATQSGSGKEMRRRLQLTRRQSVRPGKALLRFLYPETIRGTAVLVLENEERSDDLFVYLPAVRLTRRLSSSQRGDSFFGTDLSYEDVEPKRISDYNVDWASDEDVTPSQLADATNAGCTLLDVRGTTDFDSAYDRQVTCVETARSIIIWTDYYRSGKFLKRLSLDPADVRMVGDRHIPFLITVETPQRHSITKVITETYELRAKISDRLFDTWNLSAGDIKSDRRKSKPMPEPPEPNNEGL
ncbi:MAG: outer membrane lipoprotein-sorting protein [Deltaproteobacteria bacterium]|nr:outer membrane lipoprotein-sorting protein [Deltaproteobacteria bacterium]